MLQSNRNLVLQIKIRMPEDQSSTLTFSDKVCINTYFGVHDYLVGHVIYFVTLELL